jgi:mannosyl-3-phosphoglycerate phosphatase
MLSAGLFIGLMKVIFTDLDGTLLDPENYSFKDAQPALDLIRAKGIPLVLCSSKTRAEMALPEAFGQQASFYRGKRRRIFVPGGYFAYAVNGVLEEISSSCHSVCLMTQSGKIHGASQTTEVPVIGFGDMTVEEISGLTGLPALKRLLHMPEGFQRTFCLRAGG